MIDKLKDEIQKKALKAFEDAHQIGTICLSTGTGKCKVAIDYIKNHPEVINILITSPRTNLKENWRKELIKWGFIEWKNNMWITQKVDGRTVYITIENIQTVYKWKNINYDFTVADEIHTMMTPEYSEAFAHLRGGALMGLTATHDITGDNDKQKYYDNYAPIIYEYYDSAEHGLINKTRFFIVDHILDDNYQVKIKMKKDPGFFMNGEAKHYEYLTKQIKKGQRMMMAQESQDWFKDAANWFWKGYGDKDQKFAAMKYLQSIKYRKEFLQSLSSTVDITKKISKGILDANENSKVLIFSELTKQISKITPNTVYSKNNASINSNRMDDFDEGKIRELGSCQSLTLGLNLKGATHAIMESYVGSATRSKQKKGRLDRLATDQEADMWFIRVVDTQIEKWFENMTKEFNLTNATVIGSDKILNNGYDFKKNEIK